MGLKHVLFLVTSSLCFFSNAQCPNPTATDGEVCGTGTIELSASGSTGIYGWYDSNTNGELISTSANFTTPPLASSTSYYVAAYDEVTTSNVRTDGIDDYAYIQNYFYQSTTLLEVTVEAWINTTNGGDQVIMSFDRSDYWRLEINGNAAGTGQIGWGIYTNAGQLDFGSIGRVDDGNWHHVAAVYDNGIASIYIDGELDNTTTFGTAFGIGSVRYGFIGTGSEANAENGTTGPDDYFDGSLTEVRVWSVARTAEEIRHYATKCVSGGTGLEIYYKMDDGPGSSTITDFSGSGNDATWVNANTASIWNNAGPSILGCCESDFIEAVATVNPLPSLDLGENICVEAASQTLDAGVHDSYLWQDGSTNQTLNATASGRYEVTVENSFGCQSTDAIIVSLLNTPTSNDEENCGPGNMTLTASNATFNLYKWYDASTGGSLLDTGTIFQTPDLTTTTNYFVASVDSVSNKNALRFDGIDDYVALNYSFNTANSIPEMTAEAWVRSSGSGGSYNDNWAILDFDRSEYFNVYVRPDNGNVSFSTSASGSGIHDQDAPVNINDGNWHHIAAVYDGADKILYVDGIEVGRATNPHNGLALGTGITRFGFIGDGSEADIFDGDRNELYYEGDVKEVRYWSVAKTREQILAGINFCMNGDEDNLELYYKIDEGTGSTLIDYANSANGLLRSIDETTAWLNDGPKIAGCNCESSRTQVSAIIHPLPTVNFNDYLCTTSPTETIDAGVNDTYLWNDGSTNQTLVVSVSDNYSVDVTNSFGCDSTFEIEVLFIDSPTIADEEACEPTSFELTATGLPSNKYIWFDAPTGGSRLDTGSTFSTPLLNANTSYYVSAVTEYLPSLTFDGVDDYIALDYVFNTNGGIPEMTVEAWIKTDVSGQSNNGNWAFIDFDRSEYFNIYARGDNGYLSFSTAEGNGTVHDQYSTTAVNDGQWHHVAAVYDGTDKILYVDGVEIDRVVNAHGGNPLGRGTTRYGFIGDGSEAGAVNGGRNNVYYNGEIKEVKYWSRALSSGEITANMDGCIAENSSDLEFYFKIDEGTGSNTITDVVNGYTGTLYNMDINDSWVLDAPSLPNCICETAREEVSINIYPSVSSMVDYTNCISTAENVNVTITSSGGSGNFDYEETSGAFTLNSTFSSTDRIENLATGNSYEIVSIDENACTDTVNLDLLSSGLTLAGSPTTGSCLSEGLNDWVYITDVSGAVILAINDNGQDLGTISAELFIDPSVQNVFDEVYLQRHYVINTSNPPSGNVDVRFLFNNTEYNNLSTASLGNTLLRDDVNSINDIGATKYSGPTEDGVFDDSDATSIFYVPQSGNGSLLSENYVEIQVNSFSEFWLHANRLNVPLPVTYAYFEIIEKNKKPELVWATLIEENNSHFIVERSSGGGEFEIIGIVDGHGNSSQTIEYSFVDQAPINGTSYYRLVQVDYDHTESYTELKSFNNSQGQSYISVFPSPCIDCRLHVSASGLTKNDEVQLTLMNEIGQLVYQANMLTDDSGKLMERIDAGTLAKGFYIVQLIDKNGFALKQKLILE